MSEMTTPSGQDREGAAATMRDLPGETALGHVDPATVSQPPGDVSDIADAAAAAGFTPDASTAHDGDPGRTSAEYAATLPQDEVGQVRGIGDMPGSGHAMGDYSTGGEAAREALGVEPGTQGEVPDPSS
jgi:hypothetical protein